uniref:Uncharacterized protein n=1 Tax=Nothoprocta perdicaria TaxID=30464 RepID=A0A8C6ZRR1_NOTPE
MSINFLLAVSTEAASPLLKLVLSLTEASEGRLGTTAFRSIVDSCPKLRTIIKTLSKPSSSLTYTKRLLSFQTWHIQPRCSGSSAARRPASSRYKFRLELDRVF